MVLAVFFKYTAEDIFYFYSIATYIRHNIRMYAVFISMIYGIRR